MSSRAARSSLRRVVIVDDHEEFRDSLQMLLESHGFSVDAYSSGEELLSSWNGDEPACMILDLELTGMNGLEILGALRSQGCRASVIILTGTGTVTKTVQAFKLGAADLIEKPFAKDRLMESIKTAIKRDANRRKEDSVCMAARRKLALLTERETEVVRLLVDGKGTKAIAAELAMAEKTVQHHRARIRSKLEIRSVAQLVQLYRDASKTSG